MRSVLIGVAVTLVVFALAGCSREDGDGAEPPAPPDPVDELLEEVERTRPGVVLGDFVRAASRHDEARMWERLSKPSRRRLGPTLSRFHLRGARTIEAQIGSLGRDNELLLSQTITPVFAVAAVGRATQVFGAALRLENGLWRVELGSPVQVKPLRPKPGETVARRTQLAADVRAKAPLVEAGIWLDGLAFPSRGGGPTPNALTMFGETSTLARGVHYVVAFASTTANATARAWAFRAAVR